MKRFISLAVLSIGLLLAAACGWSAEPTLTATPTPTATPMKEWNLEGIHVEGSTVTVSVRVFGGIDVWATLDGKRSDEVTPTPPTIKFVFQDVTPGIHTVEIRDVVGHSETAEVAIQ